MADKIVKGTIIYKQFAKYIPLQDMNGLQWFALENNYGEFYGDIHKKYIFKKQPKLLNIGDGNVREMIEEQIQPYDDSIVVYSDPSEQYSGGRSNTKYHNIVKKYFLSEYDGTIIDEKNLKGGQKYSKEDLDGASEIVIWKDFTELLDELPSGGKKRKFKNTSKKSKRKKMKKTKRRFSF
uniref:Uncharacterized protein n=1 Tax=viral metagenome TaxID=1070528 RepID=A0A6C0IHZ0_9ZZZZ